MGWNIRFWRRTRIAPGVSLNWSRSGPSLSLGPKGVKTTLGRSGIRRTIGLPGTGLYATSHESWSSVRQQDAGPGSADRQPAVAAATATATSDSMPAGSTIEHCGFCGGTGGVDGRCSMCGQSVERWHPA